MIFLSISPFGTFKQIEKPEPSSWFPNRPITIQTDQLYARTSMFHQELNKQESQ
ncbi:hypothetical protein LguiB_021641 [Lonicera macranthoides]